MEQRGKLILTCNIFFSNQWDMDAYIYVWIANYLTGLALKHLEGAENEIDDKTYGIQIECTT